MTTKPNPFDAIPSSVRTQLTASELRTLQWLQDWDAPTLQNLANIFRKLVAHATTHTGTCNHPSRYCEVCAATTGAQLTRDEPEPPARYDDAGNELCDVCHDPIGVLGFGLCNPLCHRSIERPIEAAAL